jgi:hypothetical protein
MLPPKHPDPTPEEIAQMTAEFRSEWSAREEQRRTVGRQYRRLRVRVIKTRTLRLAIDNDDRQVTY